MYWCIRGSYFAILCAVLSTAVARISPVVYIRSLNWFTNEFRDHWVHVVLNGTNLEIVPPELPISISATGIESQVPSRHLRVNSVPRLIMLLRPQYQEDTSFTVTEMLLET